MDTPTETPRPKRGKPIAESNADLAQAVMGAYRQSSRAPGVKVVGPGGRIVDATPYLEARYRAQDHVSILTQISKWLTEEWVADHPGYEYVWPLATDKMLPSRIRTGDYSYLPESALRADCPIPFSPVKGPKGEDMIQVLDVVCVAVPPPVAQRHRDQREAAGFAAVAGNVEAFYAGVDKEGGRAEHWVEHTGR